MEAAAVDAKITTLNVFSNKLDSLYLMFPFLVLTFTSHSHHAALVPMVCKGCCAKSHSHCMQMALLSTHQPLYRAKMFIACYRKCLIRQSLGRCSAAFTRVAAAKATCWSWKSSRHEGGERKTESDVFTRWLCARRAAGLSVSQTAADLQLCGRKYLADVKRDEEAVPYWAAGESIATSKSIDFKWKQLHGEIWPKCRFLPLNFGLVMVEFTRLNSLTLIVTTAKIGWSANL